MIVSIERIDCSSIVCSDFGNGDTMMLSPSCGNFCQISSVRNGMNGCNNLNVDSSTVDSTYSAVCRARSSSRLYSRAFVSSMYQSQYSLHKNS